MPNWDNFFNDAAYIANWTLYVGALILYPLVMISLISAIVTAFVIITKSWIMTLKDTRGMKKLDWELKNFNYRNNTSREND